MPFSQKNLQSLVEVAVKNNASDIHLRTDETPALRINGDLVPVQSKSLGAQEIQDIASILLDTNDEQITEILKEENDGSYELGDLCRLRYNIFQYNKKLGIILRIVKTQIPSIEDLKLSSTIKKIALQKRGLVLVTGATGSGKSTTLAAMIKYINRKKLNHIVTIEDPIEYLHINNKSKITQREVGADTKDYAAALRASLRQDPDVILIGEMRDRETISTALKAAETGHLVLSTVHTTDAMSTIGRIIGMFSAEEQDDVRKRLADNLYATISQRMIKGLRKGSIVVAQEIMIATPGIRDCINGTDNFYRIPAIIEEGSGASGNGTQTFDQHLFTLHEKGLITKEEAIAAASSSADFSKKLIFD